MYRSFAHQYTHKERHDECLRIKTNYPDKIPIICERVFDHSVNKSRVLDKKKYLVPSMMMVSEFIIVIKKRLKMPPNDALFFMINGIILSGNTRIDHVYERHKSNDGFLYITYTEENVFG